MLRLFEEPEELLGLVSASILYIQARSFSELEAIQVCLTRAELARCGIHL